MNAEPTKKQTVLSYVLGGRDDPHFQDLSAVPVLADKAESNHTARDLPEAANDSIGGEARESTTASNHCRRSPDGEMTDSRGGAQSFPSVDEQLKSCLGDDCELIAGHIFRKPWYDREDWEVPGNGGTNDHLFEDDLFEDGDPQEYGDGSPD